MINLYLRPNITFYNGLVNVRGDGKRNFSFRRKPFPDRKIVINIPKGPFVSAGIGQN